VRWSKKSLRKLKIFQISRGTLRKMADDVFIKGNFTNRMVKNR
jgi:hypothetical protein